MYTRRLEPCTDRFDPNTIAILSNAPYTDSEGWTKNTKIVKEFKYKFKSIMIHRQNKKCAYCELYLPELGDERYVSDIEHIAHRKLYPNMTFNPDNLVLSCVGCNEYLKLQDNVVLSTNNTDDYKQWSFSIVHPYFDDPNDYFTFEKKGTVYPFPLVKSDADFYTRKKARKTIELFNLDKPERMKAIIIQDMVEKANFGQAATELIDKCRGYRKVFN